GIAPWFELQDDEVRLKPDTTDAREVRLKDKTGNTAEASMRAHYAGLAQRALARALDPASPDLLNFTRDRQPLVDAAFLAQGVLRAPRTLRAGLDSTSKSRLIAAL